MTPKLHTSLSVENFLYMMLSGGIQRMGSMVWPPTYRKDYTSSIAHKQLMWYGWHFPLYKQANQSSSWALNGLKSSFDEPTRYNATVLILLDTSIGSVTVYYIFMKQFISNIINISKMRNVKVDIDVFCSSTQAVEVVNCVISVLWGLMCFNCFQRTTLNKKEHHIHFLWKKSLKDFGAAIQT